MSSSDWVTISRVGDQSDEVEILLMMRYKRHVKAETADSPTSTGHHVWPLMSIRFAAVPIVKDNSISIWGIRGTRQRYTTELITMYMLYFEVRTVSVTHCFQAKYFNLGQGWRILSEWHKRQYDRADLPVDWYFSCVHHHIPTSLSRKPRELVNYLENKSLASEQALTGSIDAIFNGTHMFSR